VKRIPSWLTYTVLRLLVFAIPLVVLLLLGLVWWISVIAAALIGLCLSYIFLSKPRNAVSSDLYEARHREKHVPSIDDESEDAAVDSAAGDATASDTAASDTAASDTTASDTAASDSATVTASPVPAQTTAESGTKPPIA
jgi:hypothetical protein